MKKRSHWRKLVVFYPRGFFTKKKPFVSARLLITSGWRNGIAF
jgi:hypothetical protein